MINVLTNYSDKRQLNTLILITWILSHIKDRLHTLKLLDFVVSKILYWQFHVWHKIVPHIHGYILCTQSFACLSVIDSNRQRQGELRLSVWIQRQTEDPGIVLSLWPFNCRGSTPAGSLVDSGWCPKDKRPYTWWRCGGRSLFLFFVCLFLFFDDFSQ